MKITLLLFTNLFFLVFQIQYAQSQDVKGTHTFKIAGKIKMPISPYSAEMRTVEYDPNSPDHLFISDFDEDRKLVTKTAFLFKGEKFNLTNLDKYIKTKELYRDGVHINYGEDKSISSKLIYREGMVLQATTYYSNGNKQMFLTGDTEVLNGEYKMWYPNGQISYTGNYKNNLKDGSFESFDQSGNLTRKGIYEVGKLVSGESVVQDLVYDHPDVPAQFIGGETAFEKYLKTKTADLESVKAMGKDEVRIINLKLAIDKTGVVNGIENISHLKSTDYEILNSVFDEFPGFNRALVEGFPVRSNLNLNLILTNNGLQTSLKREDSQRLNSEVSPILESEDQYTGNSVYLLVEEMPEFPGGQLALRKFLAEAVIYPKFAQENGIQGKVFIGYIIKEDGSISNITVKKSANLLLDAEAVRVVNLMPKWIPGRQKGKPVSVQYTVPINFVLN